MANTWKTDSPQGKASSKPKITADSGYSRQCPMTSTVKLSASTVLPTESGIKLYAVEDSYHLKNHCHCAGTKDMNVTHVASQDELTSAQQSAQSLMSGDPTLCKACEHENSHLHECCTTATRMIPVSKRLLGYGKGLSEYHGPNLKKHKNSSYQGYAGLSSLLPSAPQDQLTSANKSSYPENYGCSTLLQSPVLVTDESTSHEIFHLDENSTIETKLMHTPKRHLEHCVGIPEYTDGILKKRPKYCCTEHEVRISDHWQVTNTECVGLSSCSFGSGAFSGHFPHKATDSNVELSVQEERATLNQMYASDESQRMALHSAATGILEEMKETNKENDGTPSVSQATELTQEMLDSSGLQYDVTSLSSKTYSKLSTSKVQFTVKLAGYSLSSQESLGNTTVQQLLESSCRKIGINTPDIYGVLCGKTLSLKDLLSAYPIYQDSTVDFRPRFRGGRIKTYAENFSVREDVLFDYVTLPQDLVNTVYGNLYVSQLSRYARYNLKELLVCLAGCHRAGYSFDGRFDKRDISYHHGKAYIRNRHALVRFTFQSCVRDYLTIRSIIRKTFIAPDGGYPEYFRHLLDYLARCPAGHHSNTEVAISFLVNHPVVQFFMDRCKQSMLLDNLLHRVFGNDLSTILQALGQLSQWEDMLLDCPAMHDCFYSDSVNGVPMKNPFFTNDPWGYIHYSNIYFKHAPNVFKLEELEAAHAFNSGEHLALILERISVNLLGRGNEEFRKQNQEFFRLLDNDLANELHGEYEWYVMLHHCTESKVHDDIKTCLWISQKNSLLSINQWNCLLCRTLGKRRP